MYGRALALKGAKVKYIPWSRNHRPLRRYYICIKQWAHTVRWETNPNNGHCANSPKLISVFPRQPISRTLYNNGNIIEERVERNIVRTPYYYMIPCTIIILQCAATECSTYRVTRARRIHSPWRFSGSSPATAMSV